MSIASMRTLLRGSVSGVFALTMLACSPVCVSTTNESAEKKATLRDRLETTLEFVDDEWLEVSYRSVTPVRAIDLRRVPDGQRAQRWQLIDESFELVHDASAFTDRVKRRDGSLFQNVRVRVPTSYTNLPKDYAPFMPFRRGGVLVYSGRFHACPERCVAGAEFSLHFKVPSGKHLLLDREVVHGGVAHWTESNAGTFVFVGRQKPIVEKHFITLVDRALPASIRMPLERHLPAFMNFFADRLTPLPDRPVLFVSLDRELRRSTDGSLDFSSEGGTLPGQIFMHLHGDGWISDSKEWPEKTRGFLPWFFAHETAHLFQDLPKKEVEQSDPWIHEGGAEAFAALAMLMLEIEPSGYVASRVSLACERCAASLERGPLSMAEARGDFRALYDCGLLVQLAIETNLSRVGRLFEVWQDFLRRVEEGDPWNAATWVSTLRQMKAQESLQLLNLLEERSPDVAPAEICRYVPAFFRASLPYKSESGSPPPPPK